MKGRNHQVVSLFMSWSCQCCSAKATTKAVLKEVRFKLNVVLYTNGDSQRVRSVSWLLLIFLIDRHIRVLGLVTAETAHFHKLPSS